MKKQFVYYGILAGLLFMTVNCAKRGNPTGGEKDDTPPRVIRAEPPNNTVNFGAKRIRIYFDEYVVLKDIQKQLIISPPLKRLPEITPQGSPGRYIDIKIKDTLQPNTTYVLNFGQSITDHNEGNPYSFFNYVFSTGSYIDSLSVSGRIQDALNRDADDFVSVMLYRMDETYADSIIYKQPPTYITNTLDSTTAFTLTNLRAGQYRMVAMKDVSNNYVFNPKTDKIAFKEEIITVPTDSVYDLKLFREIPEYRLSNPVLAARNRIIFGYEGEVDSLDITLLTPTSSGFKYRVLKDREKDSLYYWFTKIEADSLRFKVTNSIRTDTLTVKIKELYNDSLVLSPSATGNLPLKKPLDIYANVPLETMNKDKITLINTDSTAIAFTTEFHKRENRLRLRWDVQPNEKYKLTLLPGSVTDFFNKANDTLKYSFSTKSPADYGNIRVSLKNVTTYPILLQLVKEQGGVADAIYATEARELYNFRSLDPGKYYLRVIFDANRNGKWDTGNYLGKTQPERVSYYPSVIEVRANWELEETFTLQ